MIYICDGMYLDSIIEPLKQYSPGSWLPPPKKMHFSGVFWWGLYLVFFGFEVYSGDVLSGGGFVQGVLSGGNLFGETFCLGARFVRGVSRGGMLVGFWCRRLVRGVCLERDLSTGGWGEVFFREFCLSGELSMGFVLGVLSKGVLTKGILS